ncbi:MAG: glycerophosphodiester phosphodiesterase family protein [Pseudomonadota bacterium]
MMPSLPKAFLAAPLAHRALHDLAEGRPENSIDAVRAALIHGYGIEIDVQLSADGAAMVFHDYDLGRLTHAEGPVRQRTCDELRAIGLVGAETHIPTLFEILNLVAGQVPILIEIKDQDGAMGPDIGPLEQAVADEVQAYAGPVAVMSFNPHSVAKMAELSPNVARGLVTSAYRLPDWPLDAGTCARLREIPDYDHVGASFISHEVSDLRRERVHALRDAGADVLCWTVRSPSMEQEAREVVQNITFEGYLPSLGG